MKEMKSTILSIVNNHRTQYGYIAPTAYLDLIPNRSRYHLILAHLLEDKQYCEYYKNKSRRGDIIICDNGAFEFGESIETSRLVDLIDKSEVDPTYVVAPDYPGQPYQKTVDAFDEFYNITKESRFGYFVVPQSEVGDAEGWLSCYDEFASDPRIGIIGISILALPNAFCTLTQTKCISFNRLYGSMILKNSGVYNSNVWHHYLGLGAGPRELMLQNQIGIIDACDSSSPFWHGINDVRFDDSTLGLKNGKLSSEVDFSIARDDSKIEDIMFNIDYIENCLTKLA